MKTVWPMWPRWHIDQNSFIYLFIHSLRWHRAAAAAHMSITGFSMNCLCILCVIYICRYGRQIRVPIKRRHISHIIVHFPPAWPVAALISRDNVAIDLCVRACVSVRAVCISTTTKNTMTDWRFRMKIFLIYLFDFLFRSFRMPALRYSIRAIE